MMGPNATWNATNRNTYDSIFFFHSRKAGGRSVRAYLNKVAKIHRVPYCEIEGWHTGRTTTCTMDITNLTL